MQNIASNVRKKLKERADLSLKKFLIFLGVSGFVIFVDQTLKFLIAKSLPYGEPFKIMGDYIWLTYIKNPYGVWGISFPKWFPYEVVASIIIIVLILFLIFEKKTAFLFPYALLFGGAIGNLADRVRLKAVIDFIDIGISEKLRWPVFNIADSCITIGIMLLFIIPLFEKRK